MKLKHTILLGAAVAGLLGSAVASADEQFIGLPSYRVGPYASGGSGLFGGWIDYMQLVNERDGGVNGVKLTWEECETEYNNARGVECYERLKKKGSTGNSVFQPVSTGITYSVLDKVAQDKIPMVTIGYGRTDAADGRVFPWVFPMITTYWSQASAIVNFMGQKEGGMDKLKGKKIGLLYHDSAYGKESHAIMDKLAAKHGFEVLKIAVAHPGNEQQSQWLQIRQAKPVTQVQDARGGSDIPPIEMNPRFTFETFVVGGNSQFAHSAAKAVADAPGRRWFDLYHGVELTPERDGGKAWLVQTATFRPKGLWGRLYWFSLLPVHAFLFRGMARNIVGFRS
jgi:hypothetical protein